MKDWLSRALANTALRGENPRNRFARWSRWFPATPAVDAARFQGAADPCPRHWHEFPAAWPRTRLADPAVRTCLTDALDSLPATWQNVVQQRDVEGRSPAEVSASLGLTAGQQRAVLNRARVFLRERLARYMAHSGGR